ncbi:MULTISPECIES: TetR/AcrR family transcriptional regulator [Arthrobacter]|uniref:TetR/AcrR family transcriptional regulator n=2 Tax=Arthrobacter TaxID=1663 RepID=A0ABU9KIJ4_9MICC|nr:TetR/AcrR family transcriptional regulator [Arthrobacter sp. YJM1]MDP5225749.1 TetR/AcrR family transcriptional regulator [Arthrobacter sp. YJM1]
MPKIVDHDRRRIELVDATWRIIASRGIDGATMRDIAAEAGFANGALKPYFPTKERLLDFAFEHIFQRTNERMEASVHGRSGLAAVRAYCHEILPLDEERLQEARVAIAFWQKALNDPAKTAAHDSAMEQWRTGLAALLDGAGMSGEQEIQVAVGTLMSHVLGTQITAVFSPTHHSPAQLVEQLDLLLEALVKEGRPC